MDLVKLLRESGFVETTYPGQEGVFLTKRLPISTMPYAREHIVDGVTVGDSDMAVVEYLPDPLYPGGGVQMTVDKTDYYEEAILAQSPEGLGLLRDAGVPC